MKAIKIIISIFLFTSFISTANATNYLGKSKDEILKEYKNYKQEIKVSKSGNLIYTVIDYNYNWYFAFWFDKNNKCYKYAFLTKFNSDAVNLLRIYNNYKKIDNYFYDGIYRVEYQRLDNYYTFIYTYS